MNPSEALRLVPQNAEPTGLMDGDVWTTGNDLYVRLNGVTMNYKDLQESQRAVVDRWIDELTNMTPGGKAP